MRWDGFGNDYCFLAPENNVSAFDIDRVFFYLLKEPELVVHIKMKYLRLENFKGYIVNFFVNKYIKQ